MLRTIFWTMFRVEIVLTLSLIPLIGFPTAYANGNAKPVRTVASTPSPTTKANTEPALPVANQGQTVVRSNLAAIIDVRRSLPLDPGEPVYHDFYINAGPEAGYKKGMYLTVIREVSIQDPVLNRQAGTMPVTIGYLKVIQVARGITVARLFGELADDERPSVEYESVMIGDRIEAGSGTMTAPRVKAKAKSVAASPAPAPSRAPPASSPTELASIAPQASVRADAHAEDKVKAEPVKAAANIKLEAGEALMAAEKPSPAAADPGMVRAQ